MSTTAIRLHSGQIFDYAKPNTWDSCIDIDDIANALSKLCRFTGHTREFYSVAEHCINGSYAEELTTSYDRIGFLLHDAHEAYIGDINTPLKTCLGLENLPRFTDIVKGLDYSIFDMLGLDYNSVNWDLVRSVDRGMLDAEGRKYVPGWPKGDITSYDNLIGTSGSFDECAALYVQRFDALSEDIPYGRRCFRVGYDTW